MATDSTTQTESKELNKTAATLDDISDLATTSCEKHTENPIQRLLVDSTAQLSPEDELMPTPQIIQQPPR